MTWLVESPWPAITLGVVLEVALGIVLVRTGRGVVLVPMAIVLALACAGLVIEHLVVTEREEVESALDAAAAALVANDVPAMMEQFTPKSPRRREVEYLLGRVTIRDANVGGDLEIRPNALTNPPSATAYFTGRVEARDHSGDFPYEHMVRQFKVTLQHHGDRWLIHDYQLADPAGGTWSKGYVRVR